MVILWIVLEIIKLPREQIAYKTICNWQRSNWGYCCLWLQDNIFLCFPLRNIYCRFSFSLSLSCKWTCLLLLWTETENGILKYISHWDIKLHYYGFLHRIRKSWKIYHCLHLNKWENIGWRRKVSTNELGDSWIRNQGFLIPGLRFFPCMASFFLFFFLLCFSFLMLLSYSDIYVAKDLNTCNWLC